MTTMRVADYIVSQLPRLGVDRVFAITGGGAMHLNDALRASPVQVLFNQHEQACAIGAEGYARANRTLGVAMVTTGPGGTNAITGLLGMWHDSVPGLFLSGQVRFDTTVISTGLPLRQLGDQESEIIRIVTPITKYAAQLRDPERARYVFEKAVYLAQAGRPGPVWLDIPLNVQSARIDPDSLVGFDPAEVDTWVEADVRPVRGRPARYVRHYTSPGETMDSTSVWPAPAPAPQDLGALTGRFDEDAASRQVASVAEKLGQAIRPVILVGSAVQTSGALTEFHQLVERLQIPVTTAWNALDAVWQDHPLFIGRPGTIGDRPGNFAIQNADLLLVIGCRLNVRQIGYDFESFARSAELVVVDIDGAELAKPTINPAIAIQADVRWFVRALRECVGERDQPASRAEWVRWCRERRERYPVVVPEYRAHESPVNPYVFADALSDHLAEGDVVVMANGSACVVPLQALRLQRDQRIIVNSGTAGMGYDLPAAIGAACAPTLGSPDSRVICLAGDGSIQMNLQELETIAFYGLPIKVFVFNNAGYVSMRLTQDNLFGGARFGESAATGLGLPDMVAIAEAFGIHARRVDKHSALAAAIDATLATPGPALLDIVMDPEQAFLPKVIAEKLPDGRLVSKPLHDMFPWLERDEFRENILIDVNDEAGEYS
jgi:acetolactate synthase-1/2/3 large subunit